MLSLYRRVLFGGVKGTVSLLRDLTAAEIAVLAPLAIVTLWMGVHPGSFTRLFDPVIMQAIHGSAANVASAAGHSVLHVAAR
ncbi:NADH:ubiquinone reductase (H(+)-translocating) [Acetobacter pasteurianus subsp. pasteurianus]|nr:NADH:ubiquinone reductase (H(+)-translocating) [Acetobacter pasteurianus subsp. pasteurianus]